MIENTNMPKTVICTFDSIIDIDIAMINLVRFKYNNSDIIKEYMIKLKDTVIKNELLDRMDINPLSIIVQEKYINQIDSLYKQFIDKEYDIIYNTAKPTDILRVINSWKKVGSMSTSILCNNQKQVDKLKNSSVSFSKRHNIILNNDDIDTSIYDIIVIKTYDELKYFDPNKVKGKTIYIGDYVFNSIANDDASKQMNLFADNNEFKYLGVYDRSKLILVKG